MRVDQEPQGFFTTPCPSGYFPWVAGVSLEDLDEYLDDEELVIKKRTDGHFDVYHIEDEET